MPAMNAVGMNTELKTSVIAITGPVISSSALMVAPRVGETLRHPAFHVLDHHHGDVHDDADGEPIVRCVPTERRRGGRRAGQRGGRAEGQFTPLKRLSPRLRARSAADRDRGLVSGDPLGAYV